VGVRLLAAGVASLAVIGMVAAMLRVSSETRPSESERPATSLAGRLNQARSSSASDGEEGWSVTRANSAHQAMVVEIEAQHPETALTIAEEVVAPMRSRGYEEILIYVRPQGGGPDAPVRRIQWTRNGGFVETIYGESGGP
jgi:hypothetical protein